MSANWLQGLHHHADQPDELRAMLSPATSWVTGAIWNVDGGVMAGRN